MRTRRAAALCIALLVVTNALPVLAMLVEHGAAATVEAWLMLRRAFGGPSAHADFPVWLP